jgi:hypothetical protein
VLRTQRRNGRIDGRITKRRAESFQVRNPLL